MFWVVVQDGADQWKLDLREAQFFGRMGDAWVREDLYHLPDGRWVLHTWYTASTQEPYGRVLSEAEAVRWLADLRESRAISGAAEIEGIMREIKTVPPHAVQHDDRAAQLLGGSIQRFGPPPLNQMELIVPPESKTARAIEAAQDEVLEMPPKVFICYAKQDMDKALELFDALLAAGAAPWLDKWKLVLGDDWEHEIKTAVAGADAFVVLLRPGFYGIGFRQKEVRWALDALQTRPPGRGFIIPCIVEPCELPAWCGPIHAGSDLSKPTGSEDVISAIEKHCRVELRGPRETVRSGKLTPGKDAPYTMRLYCKGGVDPTVAMGLDQIEDRRGVPYEIVDLSTRAKYDQDKEKAAYERDFKPYARRLKQATGVSVTKLRSAKRGNYYVSTPNTLAVLERDRPVWWCHGESVIKGFLRKALSEGVPAAMSLPTLTW